MNKSTLATFLLALSGLAAFGATTPFADTVVSVIAPPPSQSSDGGGTFYTVVSGDCLSRIAARFLGNPSRYFELIEFNKARYPSIVRNPNLIYPGWKLYIPKAGETPGRNTPTPPTTSPTTSPTPSPTTPPIAGQPPVAPTGGMISSRSPQFKSWFNEALQIAASWPFPSNLRNKYGETITRESYLKSILYIESNGIQQRSNGQIVTSSCGALGFMQLMPATARGLGVDPKDPRQNLLGGTKFLNECFRSPATSNPNESEADKLVKAACAYNRGPYAKLLKTATWPEYVNTSTVVENVRYGIHLKMCLGLELTTAEKNYLIQHEKRSAAAVDRDADTYYQRTKGLVP